MDDSDAMAGVLTDYGRLLMRMQRHDTARKMFVRCVQVRKRCDDLAQLCGAELELAACLYT